MHRRMWASQNQSRPSTLHREEWRASTLGERESGTDDSASLRVRSTLRESETSEALLPAVPSSHRREVACSPSPRTERKRDRPKKDICQMKNYTSWLECDGECGAKIELIIPASPVRKVLLHSVAELLGWATRDHGKRTEVYCPFCQKRAERIVKGS